MTSMNLKSVYAFAKEVHQKKTEKFIHYGTAGFRTNYEHLDHVMYRMGLLAVLRSRAKKGQVIGVMITASHNPEVDNGVKLVDPAGEMLEKSWEEIATKLANVPDNDLQKEIEKIIKEQNIDNNIKAPVYVGMDTRYHSPMLAKSVINGIVTLRGTPTDFGIVTTPMLHYFVVCANTNNTYGQPTEEGYYNKLINSFKNLRGATFENGHYRKKVLFDGANGVGALKMLSFARKLEPCLEIEVLNKNGKINYNCGADFVKVQQTFPLSFEDVKPGTRCVSVDGDADRVVYFYKNENEEFVLLDGDRIATLLASYLIDLIRKIGINLKLGIVQTAYANGASTDYIVKELKVPVACVPTGVKHLHHKALEYDIGCYFEANGHGTIIFSTPAKTAILNASEDESLSDAARTAAKKLLSTINLINETVGDAISDMLLVETVLHAMGWDLKQWHNLYEDLPNLQLKVKVKDRNVITTTDAERKCVNPEGLQDEIDRLVEKYARGRAFVRPSGTEDVVRVYAEAKNQKDALHLAYEVAKVTYQMAGGVGDEPQLPNSL
uniref:Phosphoacetylglucosamine mutase n=1 Tax=Culicoides sonorensis TaxID=179676 RepID=A0A336LSL1_CULSO